MDRRTFLNASMATAVAAALPKGEAVAAASELAPPPIGSPWRTFDVITEVEIWPQEIPGKVWVPLSLYGDTAYQKTLDVRWTGNPSSTGIYRDPVYGAPAFYAQWDDRAISPKLQVINRITTNVLNRFVDPEPFAPPP